MKTRFKLISVLLLLTIFLAACSSDSNQTSNSTNNENGSSSGGVIHAAITTQPATLDPHMNTAVITSTVARTIFEQLLTLNSNYEVVPMLAESVDESEDGKSYTFHLRQGVTFHNGDEMLAEDVVASLEKWLVTNTKANLFEGAKFTIQDEYTVVLELPTRVFGILEAIANNGQFSGIMPKEIIDAADVTGVKEYIGTGPFMFKEWKQDQYIHLVKFEEYSSLDSEPNGLSGKKEALVDEVYFDITPDSSTRIAGLQTGKYDVAEYLPVDNYEQLKSDPNLDFKQGLNNFWIIYNKKEGIFTDNNMRLAVNAAINNEEILIGAKSFSDFYRLDPSYMYLEQTNWYSTSGEENYNIQDKSVVDDYLIEASYNGEEIRILTTRDYDHLYNGAVIIKEQLDEAGMNAKLEVYDWATLLDIRSQAGKWDIFVTGLPPVLAPTQILFMGQEWPGWTNDVKVSQYINQIQTSTSLEEAQQIWNETQQYLYQYLPGTKVGDIFDYVAHSKSLNGFTYFEGMVLWNTEQNK